MSGRMKPWVNSAFYGTVEFLVTYPMIGLSIEIDDVIL